MRSNQHLSPYCEHQYLGGELRHSNTFSQSERPAFPSCYSICMPVKRLLPALGILLALAAPALAATPQLGLTTAPPLVIADLDGDHQLDVAVGSRSGNSIVGFFYRIDVGLTGSTQTSSFTIFDQAATGFNIAAQDLDGDHDLDFVVTSLPLRRPIGIWINDGTGRFERAETGRYAASLWAEPHTIENIPLTDDNDYAEAGARSPVFFPIVFARSQIPHRGRRTHRRPEIFIPSSVFLDHRPPLRAPPAAV